MRRPPDHSFISLLDVLSNALGAILVLFVVLAALHSMTRVTSLNPRREGESGPFDTELRFPIRKTTAPDSMFVIQVALRGAGTDVRWRSRLDDREMTAPSWELFRGLAEDQHEQWLILKDGRFSGSWKLSVNVREARGDSVRAYVLASVGGYLLPLSRVAWRPHGPDEWHDVLRIDDEGNGVVLPDGGAS